MSRAFEAVVETSMPRNKLMNNSRLSHAQKDIDGQLIETLISQSLRSKTLTIEVARLEVRRVVLCETAWHCGMRVPLTRFCEQGLYFRIRIPSSAFVLQD